MKIEQNKINFVSKLIVALLLIVFSFSLTACYLQTSFIRLLGIMMEALVILPSHNICGIGSINGINVNNFIFRLTFLTIFLLFLVRWIFSVKKNQKNNFQYLPTYRWVVCLVFIFVILAQFQGQLRSFIARQILFSGKDLEARHNILFGYSYQFTQFCLKYLNHKKYYGEMITDLDTNEMLEPYVVAYYLYPRVEVFLNKKIGKDCLILFLKKDARNFVPENFRILAEFDSTSLVAVRK